MNCVVKFKKTHEDAIIPQYTREGDACMDVSSVEEGIIMPKETKVFDTGIKVQHIPEGWQIKVNSRSGLAAKFDICVLNAPGTVDSNYRGNIKVILHNNGTNAYKVNKGDRIAQIEPCPAYNLTLIESDIEEETIRGENGFGSSGK